MFDFHIAKVGEKFLIKKFFCYCICDFFYLYQKAPNLR